MIKKFSFGNPIDTEAVIKNQNSKIQISAEIQTEKIPHFTKNQNCLMLKMNDDDIVYGLGENVRGINKRGFIFESFNTDQPHHDEDKKSLYGSHNFFIVSNNARSFGVFIDAPGKIIFDIGSTEFDIFKITIENNSYEIYFIENDFKENSNSSIINSNSTNSSNSKNNDFFSPLESIVKQFRTIIGKSYIPPRWAFGIGQSRWGYKTADDIREVARRYKEKNLPLDMIYLDIDYMERFKDFTIDDAAFPDFKNFVKEMKSQGIRLVPIIDAGIKVEEGFDVYEEGKEKNYFCKDSEGKDFIVGVWPGKCVMPDFLNPEVRTWFGAKYKFLTDKGIEGFWNDMNEPALFYSEKNLEATFEKIAKMQKQNIGLKENFDLHDYVSNLANNIEDYKSFYHNVGGKKICHYDVHNLFGYNMTRAASDAFDKIEPNKRLLMFSRSSYIGAHRYGGIWMGDNKSRWSHLLMNLKMLPSLNMCGFLFTGADLGGFGDDITEDLLLRWYALGIFMPLFRNHSALGTREQEPFRFNRTKDFKNILSLRYRLLPYLYSEFVKSAHNNEMFARPLGFIWSDDEIARHTEDQIMIGESVMIAPVYEQNAIGRVVYLPETMKCVKFRDAKVVEESILEKGHHFIKVELNEVVIFIRKNHLLPLAKICANNNQNCALNVESVNFEDLEILRFDEENQKAIYEFYNDDGFSKIIDLEKNTKIIK